MSNRLYRLLMLWLVIALQAITPFIHAHAGTAQFDHAGWIHVHSPISMDYPTASSADLAAEVEVAQGMLLRQAAWGAADDATAAPVTQPAAAGLAAPPGRFTRFAAGFLPPPDHALPLALAPPRR